MKAHFGLDYENRVRGKNEVLLYGNFSDPKSGKVREETFEDNEFSSQLIFNNYLLGRLDVFQFLWG